MSRVPREEAPAAARAQPNGRSLRSLLVLARGHLGNFSAFGFLQAASFLIPLITIPYFARVLGISGMGVLAIANAAGLTSGVIMDYAIQLSGTRFAASHEDDHSAINKYLDISILVKLILLMPIVAVLGISALLFDLVAEHVFVFVWALISAATICLFPQWLFQGLLAMPSAARILVTSRLAAAAAALLLVRSAGDIYLVPMTQALGGIASLAIATVMLRRRYGITPRLARRAEAVTMLRQNWTLFSATAWGATYVYGNVLIMSTMLSTTSIGFYSIAQRIAQAFVSMFNIVAQTAFPNYVRSHRRSGGQGLRRQVALYMALVALATLIAVAIMYALRYQIYGFFAGELNETGVTVFVIWLIAAIFMIIGVSLNPLMVVLHRDDQMARIYRWTGLAFLLCAPFACAQFGIIGMASAIVLTEFSIAFFFALVVWRGLREVREESAL